MITGEPIGDVLGVTLILLGSVLTLVTTVGIIRFRDVYTRLHAATKPQFLGLVLMTGGLSLIMWELRVTLTLVLVVAFQLITAPISAHLLGRSAHRSPAVSHHTHLVIDEYADDQAAARGADEAAADTDAEGFEDAARRAEGPPAAVAAEPDQTQD